MDAEEEDDDDPSAAAVAHNGSIAVALKATGGWLDMGGGSLGRLGRDGTEEGVSSGGGIRTR
jgi:hypothetical protein